MRINKIQLSDQVANEIRGMILNNEYKSGDKLPVENELAKLFSVSRITVREAIKKLTTMEILNVRQGNGTFVNELTPQSFMKPLLPMLSLNKKNIQDIFAVRLLIECKATELAALNCTPKELSNVKEQLDNMSMCARNGNLQQYYHYDFLFHYELVKCGHNQVLITIQDLLMDMIKSSIKLSIQPPDALSKSLIFHKKIYEALLNKDSISASKLMEVHLEGGAYYINTSL